MNIYDRIINILLESRIEDYLDRLDEGNKRLRNKDKLKDLYRDEGEEYEREHGPQYQSQVTTGKDSLMADAAARRAMKGKKLPLPK
jgi:hypothetical protein